MAMANINDDQELKSIFLEEAQSLIDQMKRDLSDLREKQESEHQIDFPHGQPDENPVILSRLLRNAHTIKGNSGIMGFENLRKTAENLENIFKSTRDEENTVTASIISSLAESIEACHRLLNRERP
jgi:two-component system chemotaxis sensor kinase CheA